MNRYIVCVTVKQQKIGYVEALDPESAIKIAKLKPLSEFHVVADHKPEYSIEPDVEV